MYKFGKTFLPLPNHTHVERSMWIKIFVSQTKFLKICKYCIPSLQYILFMLKDNFIFIIILSCRNDILKRMSFYPDLENMLLTTIFYLILLFTSCFRFCYIYIQLFPSISVFSRSYFFFFFSPCQFHLNACLVIFFPFTYFLCWRAFFWFSQYPNLISFDLQVFLSRLNGI